MGLKWLKWFRIFISAVFFTLIAFLFLDIRNFGAQSVARHVLYLQFVPSLLKFIDAAAVGAAGFIAVLILTLLCGRVYCSTICPLGTLQDVIAFVFRRRRLQRNFKYSAPHNFFRYTVFTLTFVFFVVCGGFLLNLLDPFSTFGRIFSNLVRPVVLFINNVAAMTLEQVGVHTVYRVQWTVIAPVSIGVSLAMLILVTLLSVKKGRLYCNTICPVGTLFGLLARISLFQIHIDRAACKECKLCAKVCKAECIDIPNKHVDVTRCVGCYNCFAVCRKNGLHFKRRWLKNSPTQPPKPERRGFILNSAIWLLGITGIAEQAGQIIQNKATSIPIRVTSPVSPPGSVSVARFTSICTACHLCVSVCPSRVLAPSLLEFGLLGMMQPRMNYHTGYCDYDCTACMDVCPSGAILPLDLEEKKLTQLGTAKFIKKNCVVYTDKTNCGACSEHCPTKAVDMVPYPNPTNKPLVIPEVKTQYCVGCGACEHACPTRPYRAIYVDGNQVHQRAEKPATKSMDDSVDYKEDFPF